MCMGEIPDYVIVSTTTDNESDADRIALGAVENGLAACVQRTLIRSTYRWKGEIKRSDEFLLTAKTRSDLSHQLCAFIKGAHTYDVPEIVVTPILSGDHEYLHWIESETSSKK